MIHNKFSPTLFLFRLKLDEFITERSQANGDSVELPYESEQNVTAIYGRNATLSCSFNASTGNSVSFSTKYSYAIIAIQ